MAKLSVAEKLYMSINHQQHRKSAQGIYIAYAFLRCIRHCIAVFYRLLII